MIIQMYGGDPGQCYFWSAYGRAELDLMLLIGSRRMGFEIKHTDTPRMTRSLQIAGEDLKLDDIRIVYPGKERFPLAQGIEAVGLETLIDEALYSQDCCH